MEGNKREKLIQWRVRIMLKIDGRVMDRRKTEKTISKN